MLRQDERTAWEDAFHEAQLNTAPATEREPRWYGTAGTIAAGLLALWALFTWVPSS